VFVRRKGLRRYGIFTLSDVFMVMMDKDDTMRVMLIVPITTSRLLEGLKPNSRC